MRAVPGLRWACRIRVCRPAATRGSETADHVNRGTDDTMLDLAAAPVRGSHVEDLAVRRERLLFARRDRGDRRARDELIERFLPLARSLARRFERSGEPLEDLVQVASLGLVKAIDGFDATRGCAFSSYAVPTIVGELKRHLRN